MDKDIGYLQLILEKAKEAQEFVSGYTKEKFLEDNKTQSAVIMKLAVNGEISKKISPETKSRIDLPWKEISGFGNMAIHDYMQLSLKIIWTTIHKSLNDLVSKINFSLKN